MPKGEHLTLLKLKTPHLEVEIEVRQNLCRLLPQPRGKGEGEGDDAEEEEEEPLLNKMADQWMSIRELKKVCPQYLYM